MQLGCILLAPQRHRPYYNHTVAQQLSDCVYWVSAVKVMKVSFSGTSTLLDFAKNRNNKANVTIVRKVNISVSPSVQQDVNKCSFGLSREVNGMKTRSGCLSSGKTTNLLLLI